MIAFQVPLVNIQNEVPYITDGCPVDSHITLDTFEMTHLFPVVVLFRWLITMNMKLSAQDLQSVDLHCHPVAAVGTTNVK